MNKTINIMMITFFWALMMSLLMTLMMHKNLNIITMLIFLIFFSLTTALNLKFITKSSTFMYMTFLMMTGGMMVLLTFFLSLITNQLIMKKSILMKFMIIFILTMISLIFFFNKNNYMNFNNDLLNSSIQFNMNNYCLKKFYSNQFNMLAFMMIIYLLFSLMYISKLLLINFKAMRTNMNN